MHQEGANSSNLGRLYGTQYRVSQEGRAERPALSCLVDGKAPNHHYRYRVRHIGSNSPRRFRVSYYASGKCIIAHNPLSYADHVRPGGATLFVLEGSPSQPVIERRFPAVKL